MAPRLLGRRAYGRSTSYRLYTVQPRLSYRMAALKYSPWSCLAAPDDRIRHIPTTGRR